MARCGCATDQCACSITAGAGVDVQGGGSATNPFVISAVGPGTTFSVLSTDSVTMNLAGNGSKANPFVLSATTRMRCQTMIYTAAATWNRPTGLQYLQAKVVGGGGGGGGTAATVASAAAAAGGGGGGGYAEAWITGTNLPAAVPVSVGAGGAAAAGQPGGQGGNSSFGQFLNCNGGFGGVASGSATGNQAAGGGDGGAATSQAGTPGAWWRTGERGHYGMVWGGAWNQLGHGGGAFSGATNFKATTAVTAGADGATAPNNPGAGGSGAHSAASQAARPGGVGSAGVVIVTMFF